MIFSEKSTIKFISHLDLMRMWHRAFRRAQIKIAYTHGFHPQPRISIASPLAVGWTSDCEMMDFYLLEDMPVDDIIKRLNPQMPNGIEILRCLQVQSNEPSLQSKLRFAEYLVSFKGNSHFIKQAIQKFLSSESVIMDKRKDPNSTYDIRPLVIFCELESDKNDNNIMRTRLVNRPEAAARPDELVRAMGLSEFVLNIHRNNLIFE